MVFINLFTYRSINMVDRDIEFVIENRRSIYPVLFSGEEVKTNVIDRMLELANWAPTHRNTEPWRFKVFSGKAKNALLDQCKQCYIQGTASDRFNPQKVQQIEDRKGLVSHMIAICMKRNEFLLPEFEEIASVAMAVQNMWLYLASTPNYGGYWSTPSYALEDEFASFLQLEEDERCMGLFYVGTIREDILKPKGFRGDWKDKVEYSF